MSIPICFICGREPIDEKEFADFIETDDGYSCPDCAGDVPDDGVDTGEGYFSFDDDGENINGSNP